VVVPTGAVGDAVTAAFPAAKTVKIPPGVDTARFCPGGERAADPAVFCPADLSEPRKRVGTLVRALASLRSRLPSARLVLANPYTGRDLPSWTRGPGVEVREIAGDADLIDAYRSAWVTALPARDEPFGLVLAESMACGTPVIGAAGGGIPEVVGEGPQGALVDNEGEAAWAAALAGALVERPAEEAAQAARRRGAEFSVRRCVDSYEDLYARLLERG